MQQPDSTHPVDQHLLDQHLLDAVCAAVRAGHGDVDDLTDAAIRRLAPLSTTDERRRLRAAVLADIAGLGALDALIDDPAIDEVLVNGDQIWIDRAGELERAGVLGSTTVDHVIERILAPIGRRADRTSPIVDARLSNGARVCAVVAPVAVTGSTLSIRRFADDVRRVDDFTDPDGVELLHDLIDLRCNIVVSGATSSGKTSLLGALVAIVDPAERLVVLEDTTELPCDAPHVVRLEARPADAEGSTAITLADLVRTALRLRPDRLIVGEVRGDEVLGLVQAMNTGHDGSFSTCHANGALDALLRLESLVLQAAPQWPLAAVRQQLLRSIDVVVHVTRRGHTRRIETIVEVTAPDLSGSTAAPRVTTLGALSAGGRFERVDEPRRGRR